MASLIQDLLFRVADLERRLAHQVQIGTIAQADYGQARVRVQCGELHTGWLPWTTERAGNDRSWWAPEVGEQVVVISPGGDPAMGIVCGSVYQNAYPAPESNPDVSTQVFADGLVITHDRAAKRTTLNGRDSEGTLVLTFKNIILKTGEEGFYHQDHHGRASRITHMGGPAFQTESWSTGSVTTSLPDHGYSPSEVDV
jgi:phage baseplate assembly protein V